MAELTKTRQKKSTLRETHGIGCLAALSDSDLRKLDALSPREKKALFEEEILLGAEGPFRKVSAEDMRAGIRKKLGLDG